MMYQDIKVNKCNSEHQNYSFKQFNSQEKRFKVDNIEGFDEKNDFDQAIDQHNKFINMLQSLTICSTKRINELENAKKSKVFNTTVEYNEYIHSNAYCKIIKKRKRQLLLKQNTEIMLNKLKQKIIKHYDYFEKCAKFDNKYYLGINGQFICIDPTLLENILSLTYSSMREGWKSMKRIIENAHKTHNWDLIKEDMTKYGCPYKCDYYRCFAYAFDEGTQGCGKRVYWDISEVNFIKDFNLNSTSPIGKLNTH